MSSDQDSPSSGGSAAWAACWEEVVCLAGSNLADEELFVEAERLVRACRAATADYGIGWFRQEVEDGLIFVAEHMAADPNDADWQRIRALLLGAEAGLANVSNC